MKEQDVEQWAREVVTRLLIIAGKNKPETFRGFFMGAIVTNVIGNLPEDYWQEFKKVTPCGEPMCDCHLLAAQCMPMLEAIRRDHDENTPRSVIE